MIMFVCMMCLCSFLYVWCVCVLGSGCCWWVKAEFGEHFGETGLRWLPCPPHFSGPSQSNFPSLSAPKQTCFPSYFHSPVDTPLHPTQGMEAELDPRHMDKGEKRPRLESHWQ